MENKLHIQRVVFIVLLFCTGAFARLQAQPQIATDYNTCLVGVKNNAGNWYILPQYESLKNTPVGYIAQLGGRYGLISKSGRVLIPIEYDFITELFEVNYGAKMPAEYFVVRNEGKKGVMDTANRVVVPLIHEWLNAYSDSTIAARVGRLDWYFYRLNGEKFAAPWKSPMAPHQVLPHVYAMQSRLWIVNKEGLVNDSGRVLQGKKYSDIRGCPGTMTIRLTKKEKYGFCSAAGKMIWPMNLEYEHRWDLYSGRYNYIGDVGTGPARSGGKWGLITVYGDTLLPFIYDGVEAFGSHSPRGSNLWVVHKDNLWGIYDDHEGWKIPMECAEIKTLSSYRAETDSVTVGLMLYNIGKFWGVKTTSGQEILPCVYEEYTFYTHKELVLRKGDSLLALCFPTTSNRSNLINANKLLDVPEERESTFALVEFVPDSRKFSVFSGREGVTAWYNPANTHGRAKWSPKYDGYRPAGHGEYYNFVLPDSIIVSCAFYTQPLVHPVITGDKLKAYHLNNLYQRAHADTSAMILHVPGNSLDRISAIRNFHPYPRRYYGITSAGDVFTRDGQLLISGDSVHQIDAAYHGANGSIYFEAFTGDDQRKHSVFDSTGKRMIPYERGYVGDFSERYYWRVTQHHYALFDLRTRKQLLAKEDYSYCAGPLWDSITIIENEAHGVNLYNIPKRTYVSATGFERINPLRHDGTAFAVKTCTGKIGIMNASGELIADTIWTAYTPVDAIKTYPCTWSDHVEWDGLSFYSRYIFSNGTMQYVFDPATLSMQPTENETQALWAKTIRLYSNKSLYYHFIDSAGKLPVTQHVDFFVNVRDTAKYLTWHRECIIDTLYASLRVETTAQLMLRTEENKNVFPSVEDEYWACAYCRKRGALNHAFVWTRPSSNYLHFAASLVTPEIISFSRVYGTWTQLKRLQREWHTNVMLFPDGPRSMLIDSLFKPESDWRNYIITSVLNYVNTEPDVEGDCHNPAGLPALLKTAWLFEEDGIRLFPPGFTQSYTQLSLTLHWDELDPYLRDDVRQRLPAPNE